MPIHVRFDVYLDYLVDNQYRENNEQRNATFRKIIVHPYFLPLFLASMLNVA